MQSAVLIESSEALKRVLVLDRNHFLPAPTLKIELGEHAPMSVEGWQSIFVGQEWLAREFPAAVVACRMTGSTRMEPSYRELIAFCVRHLKHIQG